MHASLRYRPDIDGLRAIAVLLVMGFHAFPGRVPGGFVGVDVFFVISGYLITALMLRDLRQGSFSLAGFYERRVRRIFPALALLLLTVLPVGALGLAPTELAQLGQHAAAGAAFVANLVLWAQSGYFAAALESKPLLHLWSLGVEEQFYLAWPVTLALLFRSTRRLGLGVAAIAAVSFLFNLYMVGGSPDAAYFWPVTRLWELLVGGLVACGGETRAALPPALRTAATSLGLALVVLTAFAFDGSHPFPGWRAALPVLGTALAIAAGPEGRVSRLLLANPVLVAVGLISYPLYLWHWPALSFVPLLDLAWSAHQERLLKLAALAGATLAAFLTYRYVERPIRRREGPSTVTLCAVMAGVFLAGAAVAVSGGGRGAASSTTQREMAAIVEQVQRQRGELYRDRRCCLGEDQDEAQFAPECVDAPARRAGAGTLLWGDSHAAHLSPGMRARGISGGLAQFTATSCPPILGYAARGRPHCASINRWVMGWVREHRPRTVLLAASWPSYDGYQALSGTVAELKSLGVPRVLVVGPFPSFRERVLDVLAREGVGDSLPERLPSSRLERLRRADLELRSLAVAAGAEYVSPLESLCNEQGCLVAPGGRVAEILVFDQSHLTPLGSRYVADRLLGPTLD